MNKDEPRLPKKVEEKFDSEFDYILYKIEDKNIIYEKKLGIK